MNVNEIIKTSKAPFYVFDTSVLKKRIEFLRSHLPSRVRLCYAVKANTFITREVEKYVDLFEICSPGEAHICNTLNIPPEKTVISGLYKTPSHTEELMKEGADRTYTAESVSQLRLLASLAEKYGRMPRVLMRLTNDSQFGMNDADIYGALTDGAYSRLVFCGVQFFSGTQKTSLKKLKRELDHTYNVFSNAREIYGEHMRTLEYGAGFPVKYFADEEFDEKEFLKGFSELITALSDVPEITLELGRSIAASCGSYFTHITDIKQNKGLNYAVTDGGMHQLVYYGQQMAMRVPNFSVCGKEDAPAVDRYNICGALCSMNDIILKNAPLPKIEIGDVLRFENVGAYSPTEGIALFLSRELPAIYISDGENAVCVREPFETYTLNTPHYPAEL